MYSLLRELQPCDSLTNLTVMQSNVAANTMAPSTSTAWESPGSLWDLQQPSDLETFYCQLKNSASSSDHQPATELLQTTNLEELERTKRAELLAIQHQLRRA